MPKEDFKLVRYYDTCCDRCGNWATGDIDPRRMSGNKTNAEKTLKREGWKVFGEEVVCGYCLAGETR